MKRRHFHHTITTVAAVAILAVAGFGQGKGHGGGNPHGGGEKHGGGGNGRGQEMRVQQPGGERGHGNNGNGKGNGWGRRGDDEGQRQVWQQQQQQQRQNEWKARRQQQDAYRQQQQAMRQQQEYYRQQQRQQYQAQRQYQNQQGDWNDDRGRGHGKKNGWDNDGPRGNAYGRRGIWPGEFRGWRDPEKQERKAEKEQRRSYGGYNTYGSDPFTAFIPRIYRERYQQPNYAPQYYGGYTTPQYYRGYSPQYYGYSAPNYYYPSTSGHSTRDAIVRTVLSAFFGGGDPYGGQYYDNGYSYAQPAYSPYYGYSSYASPYQTSYNPLGYSYYPAGYAYSTQAYYPSNYNDPYYAQPMFGSGLFGGGGLKSTLLNVGLSMLQGFMGQGYEDGIYAGQYARRNRINEFYDPYTYDSPAYYSPYVSSLANERQAFDEGYRLGYQDAMRQQDPYGALRGRNDGVDLLTEFLSSGLLG
jgi:hypothetical protein